MATIQSKYLYSPPIQFNFIDPNTGAPATGDMFFFIAGTSTPKNAYIYSGDPQNPYVAVTSLPLNGAGSPNQQIFYYLVSEIDNVTPQLYRISVTNSLGVEVFVKDDYPYSLDSSGGSTSGDISKNLLAGYGFESENFPSLYGTTAMPTGKTYVSPGAYFEFDTTNTSEENTYTFSALGDSGILANPHNSLTLKCTNNAGGDLYKRFGWRIGQYNDFQNVQLAFSIHIQKINGNFNTIPLKLIRDNSISMTPDEIVVGSVPVTSSLVQHTLTFTVPVLPAISYNPQDSLHFLLDFPLNEDYELIFTATWLQESSDGNLFINKGNAGENLAKSMFQNEEFFFNQSMMERYGGQKMIVTPSGVGILEEIGKIDLIAENRFEPPFHSLSKARMDGSIEFLTGQRYGETTTDRYIEYQLNSEPLRRTPFVFNIEQIATPLVAMNVSTSLATTHLRPASAVAGPRITHSVIRQEFEMGVEAYFSGTPQVSGGRLTNYNFIEFIWRDVGQVTTGMYVPEVAGPLNNWTVQGPGGISPNIANYLGGYVLETSNTNPYNGYYYINTNGGQEINPVGGQSSAIFSINNKIVLNDNRTYNQFFPTYETRDGGDCWSHLIAKVDSIPIAPALPTDVIDFTTGYLAWQDPATPVAPITNRILGPSMDNIYKFILGFAVDSFGSSLVPTPTAGGLQKIVKVESSDTVFTVVKNIITTVNNPRIDNFTFVDFPLTGDYLLIDNGKTRFQIIFYLQGDARPTSLPGEFPLYVEFTNLQNLADISLAAENAILRAVGGIPNSDYLGLAKPQNLDFAYYVNV